MLKTMAIVYAPGVNSSQLEILKNKLESFLDIMNFYSDKIGVKACPEFELSNLGNNDALSTLIIGWGLSIIPDWSTWAYEIKTSMVIRLFIGIDLYEQCGTNGRVLMLPNFKSGRHWRQSSWQTRLRLFLKGCYVSHITPYGMKRAPKWEFPNHDLMISKNYILVPGLSEEIEIVRLIYNLFVKHGYTLTEIANLLNAQNVNAPNQSKFWNSKKVKSLITSVSYIGSNQFGACVRHNVFPALIDRSTFCAAQARIYGR